MVDAVPVDVRPVEAVEVDDLDRAVYLPAELGVPSRDQEVVDDEIAVRIASDVHDVELNRMPTARRWTHGRGLGEGAEVDGLQPPRVVLARRDLEVGSGSERTQVQAQGAVDQQPLDRPPLVVDPLLGERLERPAVLAVAKNEMTVADARTDGAYEAAPVAADDDLGKAGPEDRRPPLDGDLDTSAGPPVTTLRRRAR